MAGYIFLLNELSDLDLQTSSGTYSTNMVNPIGGFWSTPMESTIADYVTMKEGDNIYFFTKRKIYGIGELVKIKGKVLSENFPESFLPKHFDYSTIKNKLLLDRGSKSAINRLVCFFRLSPHFFRAGVDMDDVLSSSPDKFKMLRLIQQVSFIKVDDEENQALKNIILKRALVALSSPNATNVFDDHHVTNHKRIRGKINNTYKIKLTELLKLFINSDGSLKHEMLVECAILHQISYNQKNAIDIFGKWDYLSHQTGASPFKPIMYMDRMDIFGYAYIPEHRPTIERYLVIEVKRGLATIEDLNQLMKYVDWIKNEYAHYEYAPINAFLVASNFEPDIDKDVDKIILRNYTVGSRPPKPASWANVKLVKYFTNTVGKISFVVKNDFNAVLKN